MERKSLTNLQKALIVLALVLAAAIRFDVAIRDKSVPEKDATDYDHIAMNVVKGRGFRTARGNLTAYRLPGYPLFLASIYRTVGHNYQAARVVQAFLSTATVLMIALWAFVLFGGWSACWAAFIAAVYPAFYAYYFSCSVLGTETLYTFLLTGSLFTLFLYFSAPSWPRALVSGLFWSAAIMTRGLPLPLLVILPLAMVRLRYPLPHIVRYHAMVWLVSGILLVPWVVRNYSVFGAFVPLGTNLGENFYLSNMPKSDGCIWKYSAFLTVEDRMLEDGMSELEISNYLFGKGVDFICSKPKEAFRLFLRKIYIYLDPRQTVFEGGRWVVVPEWGFIFVAFASTIVFFSTLRNQKHLRSVLLFCFIFGYFVVFHGVMGSINRYRFPTEPILIVMTSWVLGLLGSAGRGRMLESPDHSHAKVPARPHALQKDGHPGSMNRWYKAAFLLRHDTGLFLEVMGGQLAKRFGILPRTPVVKEVQGVRFAFDFEYGPQIREMYFNLYEPLTVAALRRFLSKGDTFVDVGASVGYISWIAAGIVGQKGQVHCFEPSSRDFRKLEEFRLANPDFKIFCRPYALGETEGSADMDVSGLDWVGWNTLVPDFMRKSDYKETVQIQVRTLADYIREHAKTLSRIAVIKIDTEGYEFFVLKGLASFLEETAERPAILCEVAPRANGLMGISMQELSSLMARYGYQAYSLLDSRTRVELTDLKVQTTDVIFLCQQ